MSERYDVVVVGGGIAGIGGTRELAEDTDVLLLERDQLAGGATGHASGLVTVVPDYKERPEAARYSIDWFRTYDGTDSFSFHERPFVQLRTDPDMAGLREAAAAYRDRGFSVTAADPEALDDRFPEIFELGDHTGAEIFDDAGWLDPYTYAMALTADARDRGADLRTGVEVVDLIVEDGTVRGVETAAGTVRSDHVVVAAGWRTAAVADLELPTRPFRYQTTNLRTETDVTDYPIAWDQESRLYWRPELDGELHVGGGAYYVTNPGTRRRSTTEGFGRLVAQTIPARLPGLIEPRFGTDDTCPSGDTATPDGYPIIDEPNDAPSGLVVATGLHGFGIMAGPAVGRAIRAIVLDEDTPFPLEPYRLDRFDTDVSWEFPYISKSADETGP